MPTRIGTVDALYRYPVKSMAGERIEAADVGWHGLAGDRRLAFRRLADRGGFPWLTASRLPDLILHVPLRLEPGGQADLPTHVRTPDGRELAVFGNELAAEVGRRCGMPVEMMYLDRGIFDEASVSVIAAATIRQIASLAAQAPDVRRFRPNVLIAATDQTPFEEEGWVGGTLVFGDADEGASITVTNHDERCAMVNLEPDTARPTPEVLKAIVGARANRAGVYAAVSRRGRIATGQPVFFEPAARQRSRA